MKKITDLEYLIKLKNAGLSTEAIAKKLGITPEEVHQKWKEVLEISRTIPDSYSQVVTQFNILCHQYQLLGESLKLMSEAISNRASKEDVMKAVQDLQTVESSTSPVVEAILQRFIVLQPFVAKDPAESFKEMIQGN